MIIHSSNENISSPRRYWYVSILPDNSVHILAASLLISYCIFSFLILSSIAMISFYILSRKFCLKRKDLSNAKVVSINIILSNKNRINV